VGAEKVATENVALLCPAGTTTRAGTRAEPVSLETDTVAPPAGAGAVSATVAVAEEPPIKLDGLSVRELGTSPTPGGEIVKTVLWAEPL